MSLFQQPANLNYEGVSFLVDGKHIFAIDSLSRAVQLLQMELSTIDYISSSQGYKQEDFKRNTTSALGSYPNNALVVEIPSLDEE
jgi:hypothetical protein